MAVEYTLICDECSRVIDASRLSAAEVRRRARAQGIAVRKKANDVCRICVAERTIEQLEDPK